MADSSDDYFYKNVIDMSSDESDENSEILMAMAFLLHDQEQRLPKYMGSVKGRIPTTKRGPEEGHAKLWRDYFHQTNPFTRCRAFIDVFGYQGTYF
jgi:hypothetical protein